MNNKYKYICNDCKNEFEIKWPPSIFHSSVKLSCFECKPHMALLGNRLYNSGKEVWEAFLPGNYSVFDEY